MTLQTPTHAADRDAAIADFDAKTVPATAPGASFAALGLSPATVSALARLGMTAPKPIQEMAIPAQLAGNDVLGLAQTGSGKTAAFGLPIVEGILALKGKPAPRTTRALILAPTRELAVQIEEQIVKFAHGARLSTAIVLGGASRGGQAAKLRRGVDVVVATPGRLLDLIEEGCLSLSETRWFVLDEADRMLDMGFILPVRRIAAMFPARRQTALFSATMPREVEALAASLLHDPVRVEAAREGTLVAEVAQRVMILPTSQKRARLAEILGGSEVRNALIFARTKHGADRVVKDLERDGFEAEAIHGNKSQNARQRALTAFRNGSLRFLVATDIASRGIDVPGISHVINFELPDQPESYAHRIGRTGRNGATGVAITLCDHGERDKLRAIERTARIKFKLDGVIDERVPLAKTGGGGNGGGGRPPQRHGAPRSQHGDGGKNAPRGGGGGRPPRGDERRGNGGGNGGSNGAHGDRDDRGPRRPANRPARRPHAARA